MSEDYIKPVREATKPLANRSAELVFLEITSRCSYFLTKWKPVTLIHSRSHDAQGPEQRAFLKVKTKPITLRANLDRCILGNLSQYLRIKTF